MSKKAPKPPRDALGGSRERSADHLLDQSADHLLKPSADHLLKPSVEPLLDPHLERKGDPLEELMRMEESYIEDAGFTARVLESLPPPRARLQHRRLFVLALFFSLAFSLAFILFPGLQQVTLALVEVTRFEDFAGELPIVSMVVIAMLVWSGVMAAWSEG